MVQCFSYTLINWMETWTVKNYNVFISELACNLSAFNRPAVRNWSEHSQGKCVCLSEYTFGDGHFWRNPPCAALLLSSCKIPVCPRVRAAGGREFWDSSVLIAYVLREWWSYGSAHSGGREMSGREVRPDFTLNKNTMVILSLFW